MEPDISHRLLGARTHTTSMVRRGCRGIVAAPGTAEQWESAAGLTLGRQAQRPSRGAECSESEFQLFLSVGFLRGVANAV